MDNINFKGFTAIDNTILFDSSISNDSKVFLMQFRHILKTKQHSFNPCKAWILKVCGISEKMYRKVMKELKDFIELVKTRVGKKYEYTYKLLKDIFTPVEKAKDSLKKNANSVDGQQTIEDIGFDIDEYKGVKKQYKKTYKPKQQQFAKKLRFTNYEQRDIDYDSPEYDFLYGWD